MPCGRVEVAASEHPVPVQAVAECAGALLERGVEAPDLLLVAAGRPFDGALGDIVAALVGILSPTSSVAVVSAGLLGGGRVVDGGPALVVTAVVDRPCHVAWLPPDVHLDAVIDEAAAGAVATVLADPFSVRSRDLDPGPLSTVEVIGGNLSAGAEPGSNRLVVDGVERRDGAAVVLWNPGFGLRVASLPGLAAMGDPMEVTGAEGTILHALDGRPAESALTDAVARFVDALDGAAEIGLVRVVDGAPLSVTVDPGTEWVRTGTALEVGAEVRLAVRSAPLAHRELLVAISVGAGDGVSGALCFLDRRRPGVLDPGAQGAAAALSEMYEVAAAGLVVGGVIHHVGVAGRPGPAVSATGRGTAGVLLFA